MAAYERRRKGEPDPYRGVRLTWRPEWRAIQRSQIPLTPELLCELVHPQMAEEDEWRPLVQCYATQQGWKHYHTYDSRRSPEGYVDLTLIRERIVFVELKTNTGILRPSQRAWRDAIQNAGGEWYLFRPRDAQQVVEVLA